jgi:hypothetical protein
VIEKGRYLTIGKVARDRISYLLSTAEARRLWAGKRTQPEG